jgi:hypothetical protein
MTTVFPIRCLLALASMVFACSCAKLPEAQAMEMPTSTVAPEFSGGGTGLEIAEKKAALTAEYERLASVEAELDREKTRYMVLEAGNNFGAAFFRSTRGRQTKALASLNRSVAVHKTNVARLRRELAAAGVTTITRG